MSMVRRICRFGSRMELREKVLALRRRVLGPEHPDTVFAMQTLANFFFSLSRWNEALTLREEVLAIRRKLHGALSPCGPRHGGIPVWQLSGGR